MVVKAEWEKFIIEEKLSSLMEGRTKGRHFFINIGSKERLGH
jgi:hypothetical protein